MLLGGVIMVVPVIVSYQPSNVLTSAGTSLAHRLVRTAFGCQATQIGVDRVQSLIRVTRVVEIFNENVKSTIQ